MRRHKSQKFLRPIQIPAKTGLHFHGYTGLGLEQSSRFRFQQQRGTINFDHKNNRILQHRKRLVGMLEPDDDTFSGRHRMQLQQKYLFCSSLVILTKNKKGSEVMNCTPKVGQ